MTVQTTSLARYFRPYLSSVDPYKGVETVESLALRLGLDPSRISKLDANENPYGPSPKVREALSNLKNVHRYPDPLAQDLRARVAEYAGVEVDQVFLGAGADELLELVVRLFIEPGDLSVDSPPTFSMYTVFPLQNAGRVISVPRDESWGLDVPGILRVIDEGSKVVWICTPNNPTGNSATDEELLPILETGVPVVLDEAYYEFCGRTRVDWLERYPNLIIMRTFSKLAGLAGMRVGYMLAHEEIVAQALKIKQPYNVTVASQAAALASLDDLDRLQHNVELIVTERDRLGALLREQGTLIPYPSDANYIMCKVNGDAKEIHSALASRGVFIRYFAKPGIRNCLRVSVGKPEDTDRLLEGLNELSQRNSRAGV